MKTIDLRSDTVTQPSQAMRQAMAEAEVGDDVYRDDPTVNRLESYAAELLGFEAAIFTASGTQANLIGIMSHCGRGDEYIVGQLAHTYKYEGGGAAVLGSIQPQPIEFEPDSTLSLTKVEEKIKPDDIHFARTRLLCLENTQNGKALPLEYLQQAATFARDKKLSLHLDGARLFNAAVKQNVRGQRYHPSFRLCLCLPVQRAGGTGRLTALRYHAALSKRQENGEKWSAAGCARREFLPLPAFTPWKTISTDWPVDHEHAAILTEGLSRFDQLQVTRDPAQTNMVFFTMEVEKAQKMADFLKENNILITAGQDHQAGHSSRYQPCRYRPHPGKDRPVFQSLSKGHYNCITYAELTAQTEATPSLSRRSKKLSTTSTIQACFLVQ